MYKLLSHLTKDNKLLRFGLTNLRTLSNTANANNKIKNKVDEDTFGASNKYAEQDTVKSKARLENVFKTSTNKNFSTKKTRYNNNNVQKYEKKKKFIYNDNNYYKNDAQTFQEEDTKANRIDDSDTFGTLSEEHKDMYLKNK